MLKRKKVIVLVLIFLLLISLNVNADTDDYYEWTWSSSTTELSIQVFSSAEADYWSKISNNCFAWSSIDDNIYFDTCQYRSDDDDLGHEIHFYGEELTGTTMATAGIYDKYLLIWWQKNIHTYTGEIDRAVITLDTRTEDGLLDQSSAEQIKTIIHEIGHTVALAHPDCGSTAIMQQGYSSPAALTIQSHDEDNLQAKW